MRHRNKHPDGPDPKRLANLKTPVNNERPGESPKHAAYNYRNHLSTKYTKTTNTTTPVQKIHLSCFALRSTMRIVSPETPNVFATLYNFLCVFFRISRCSPRSPSTARPRSRYSSNVAFVDVKKFCSRRAWFSRAWSPESVLSA
jgi:hypothetical protein